MGDLQVRTGTYFRKGSDLLILGREDVKQCVISVSQDDVQDTMAKVGRPVRVRIGSSKPVLGTLRRVEPRASAKLPHPAFAATKGGPIAVKDRTGPHGESSVEFAEPRFKGVVDLLPEDAKNLASGERGYARVGYRSETLGRWLFRGIRRYIEQRTQQATASH